MDLHLIPDAIATEDERVAIDAAITDRANAEGRRHLLLPALHAAQARVGWVSEGALNHICASLDIPPAEAYGVASFYALLSLTPRPPSVVHVCDDIACLANGATTSCEEIERRLGHPGALALDGQATWHRSPCIGLCERAPAALYQLAADQPRDWTLPDAEPDAVVAGLRGYKIRVKPERTAAPQTAAPRAAGLRLLRRIGIVDPSILDDYRAHGGFGARPRVPALAPRPVAA